MPKYLQPCKFDVIMAIATLHRVAKFSANLFFLPVDDNGSCNDNDDIGDDQVPQTTSKQAEKSSFNGERKTFRHLMKHLFLMLTILRKPNSLLSILGSSGLMK